MVRGNLLAKGRELTALITRLSEITGNPRDACFRFARDLGLAAKKPYRKWSQKESDLLLQLLESQPKRIVALKLKRSPESVESMQRRLGVNSTMYNDTFSKHQLAALLHIRPRAIQKWIDDGLLEARIEGSENVRRIVIDTGAFARFCKQHPDAILRGHVREDRLEFVFKFVFPRSHVDLLPVRQAKRERRAYAAQMQDDSDEFEPETDFTNFKESGSSLELPTQEL
ncbi:MAG TPA: hypothetical protein VJ723_13240 [Candidatus Angelobacter sp.]|nr:hypothetical protein [Candidatus Angelobacter sp.]